MSEKAKAVINAYCAAKGWPECKSADDYYEALCLPPIYRETRNTRRWWTEVFTVVDLAGTAVGYIDGVTTGDDSARDKGWEFDPDSICLVERHDEVKTVTTYLPIEETTDA